MLMSAWHRAAPSQRARVILVLSIVGLVISTVNLAVALPILLSVGGPGPFVANAAGTLWTIGLLALVTVFTRTLPWRAVLGVFFVGFFGCTALATLVGKPVISALGAQSPLATAVVVPITEEVFKAAPVIILLVLARRHRSARPSTGDAVLLGAAVGAGFALYEDALFGRSSGAGWINAPPFSWLIPSVHSNSGGGITMLADGHIVYTALVALGLAVGLLYGRHARRAWLAIPVTLVVVVLEHMSANEVVLIAPGEAAPAWVQLTSILTLDGYLSAVLLVGGLALATAAETRALRRACAGIVAARFQLVHALVLNGPEIALRAAALAAMQVDKTPLHAEPAGPPVPLPPTLPPAARGKGGMR
jgi:RsiW-degrading membrane proteinase PrsW (M82 family)